MARQSGNIFITGTIDNLCFYKMDGQYYVRLKSSLTRKRVKRDPAFARTMQHARLLGEAAKLASVVYKTVQPVHRRKGLYKQLTGIAIRLIKEGKTAAAVVSGLNDYLRPTPSQEIKKVSLVSNSKPVSCSKAPLTIRTIFPSEPVCQKQIVTRRKRRNYRYHSGFV